MLVIDDFCQLEPHSLPIIAHSCYAACVSLRETLASKLNNATSLFQSTALLFVCVETKLLKGNVLLREKQGAMIGSFVPRKSVCCPGSASSAGKRANVRLGSGSS